MEVFTYLIYFTPMNLGSFFLLGCLLTFLTACSSGDGIEPFAKAERKKQDMLSLPQTQMLMSNKWCSYFDGTNPKNDYEGFVRLDFAPTKNVVVERYDEFGGVPIEAQADPETSIWDFDGSILDIKLKDNEKIKIKVSFTEADGGRDIMNTVDVDTKIKNPMWECNGSVQDAIPSGYGPGSTSHVEDEGGIQLTDEDEIELVEEDESSLIEKGEIELTEEDKVPPRNEDN